MLDGAFHDVDSSALAFEIAARACAKQGLKQAGLRLMEPIMQVGTKTLHQSIHERQWGGCALSLRLPFYENNTTVVDVIGRYNYS